MSLQFLKGSLLLETYSGIVYLQDINGIFVIQTILVDTNNGLSA